MPDHPVISARGLGKCFRIWTHSRPTSLADRVEGIVSTLRHRQRHHEDAPPRREEIWALRDVSFDVQRGQVLGVIGPNGAGKSTLLSILARITEPTTGLAELHGRVSSLLEVGTGFHPELSGRDNIYLNGAVLGMSRREVDEKFDEIVEFSGVADFIDVPVKRFSSGMYVRLGFSVAAHLDPEVLLLDEVLAVGDSAFQQKCLRRINELTQSGRTVLFVSHTPSAVAQLCQRAIVINEGRIVFDGDVDTALDAYLNSPQLGGGASAVAQETANRDGTGEVRITAVRVAAADGGVLMPDRPVRIEVDVAADRPGTAGGLSVDLGLRNTAGAQLVTLSTRYEADDPVARLLPQSRTTLVCELDDLPLRPDRYAVSVAVERHGELLDSCRHQADFTLHPSDFYNSGFIPLESHPSVVLVRQRWRIESAEPARQAAAT